MNCINYKSGQCGSSGHYCVLTCSARQSVEEYYAKYPDEKPKPIPPTTYTEEELKVFGKWFAKEVVRNAFPKHSP